MMNLVTKLLPLLLIILLWICLNGINFTASGILLLTIVCLISYGLAFYTQALPASLKFKISFLWYFLWLIKEIIKSTVDVLKIIWGKDMSLSENMQWLTAKQSDETFLTIYGNSITLTPGTVTLDVKDNMLLIHSLKQASFEDLQKGEMESRIKNALKGLD